MKNNETTEEYDGYFWRNSDFKQVNMLFLVMIANMSSVIKKRSKRNYYVI